MSDPISMGTLTPMGTRVLMGTKVLMGTVTPRGALIPTEGPIDDTSLAVFTVAGQSAVDGGTLNLAYTYIGDVLADLAVVAVATNLGATVGAMTITPSPLIEGNSNVMEFDVTAQDGSTMQHYNVTLDVDAPPPPGVLIYTGGTITPTGWSANDGLLYFVGNEVFADDTVTAISIGGPPNPDGDLDVSGLPLLETINGGGGFPMSSLNIAGLTNLISLDMGGANLTHLDGLSGITAVTLNIDLRNNHSFTEAAVDAVLAACVAAGGLNGTLNLSGTTAPSAGGLTDKATLDGRGWAVTVT